MYTGDIIKGKKVITSLEVKALEKGVHEFFFENTENNLGQSWYIPITVIKGSHDGTQITLNSGTHGNELNSMVTVSEIKNILIKDTLKGSIIIIHGYNTPGLINNTRYYSSSGDLTSYTDMNRQTKPVEIESLEDAYARNLWDKVIINNSNELIDLHTGGDFPMLIYADYRNKDIATMSKLIGAEIVKMDDGEPGSLETNLVDLGIPALTLELGGFSKYEKQVVDRATKGIINYLRYKNLLEGSTFEVKDTFIGNSWEKLCTTSGGLVKTLVSLKEKVTKGQEIAIQYDSFGNIAKRYISPVDGVIAMLNPYPLLEPMSTIARVIYYDSNHPSQKL